MAGLSATWPPPTFCGAWKQLLTEKRKNSPSLEGVIVLDLADEQGSFCSKLLADLGATVVRGEPPEGESTENSLACFYQNTNKLRLDLDPRTGKGKRLLHQWIGSADILVETFSAERRVALELTPERTSRLNPRLIHLSITGFGRTGPRSAYRVTDSVVAAFGGQMYVTGAATGGPTMLFYRQSFYTASLFGANAALLSLRKRALTGKGGFIDLSIQEAVASALDPVMIQYFAEKRIAGREIGNPARSFSLLRCKDGYIQITISRNWETLLDLMRAEGKAADLTERRWQKESYRTKHHGHVLEVVQNWTRTHRKQELFKLGQAMQFPWAPVASPEEIVQSPQLRARHFFIAASRPKDLGAIFIPGSPYKFHPIGSNLSAPALLLSGRPQKIEESLQADLEKSSPVQRNRRLSCPKSSAILRGIRVLDLTRMLSGPYATRMLGDFGAEIIKVQSKKTARGAEQNDTPYFRAWNRNKRSICLDLNHPDARDIFLSLTAISDVVIENFSPRVLKNLGLNHRSLGRLKPDLIMASISAMGQKGSWRNYVGYAPTFHALSGMTYSAMRLAGAPADIGNSFGDIVAGLYAALAILAAIHHREKTGQGQYIDLSAYESACTLLGPVFQGRHAVSMDGNQSSAHENTLDDFGGCYPCAGIDRWCVLHLFNESEWRAFCRICSQPELKSSRFSTPQARRKHRGELDAIIARWTAGYKVEMLVRRLQKARIAAGVVQNARDLANDGHLAARHFFTNIGSTSSDKNIADRSALWPWNEKPSEWKTAPRLGEDNGYVFKTLLGYSEAQYRALKKQGVIA